MNSKRVNRRFRKALPVIWAAFACAGPITEAVRRQLGSGPGSEASEGLAESSGRLFLLLGRGLLRQLRELVAVDARYQALRERQRRNLARRDRIAGRLYRETVDGRRFLKGLLGYEGACRYLGLKGETAREPQALFHQIGEAVEFARRREPPASPQFGDRAKEARKVVDAIGVVVGELDRAIDDVVRGRARLDAAMLLQRRAMRAFDRVYRESARTIEAQLIAAGLPTLGDAVRPGVGRRGRPRKRRPVDHHPDLVARVRAEGLMALDLAEELARAKRAEARAAEARTAEGDPEGPHETAPAAEGEAEAVEAGARLSRRLLPPPVAACPYDRARSRPGYRPATRRRVGVRPPATESSGLERLKRAASTWWGRLKPAA